MEKVEFPPVRVPAQDQLSSYQICNMIRQHMEAGTVVLRNCGAYGLVSGSIKPDVIKKIGLLPNDQQRFIIDVSRDVVPYQAWRKYREVYDVHPAMTDALMRMSATTDIPGSVFERLRHPNPLFVAPAGVPFTHADGHPGRILGFHITGAISNAYPVRPDAKARLGSAPEGAPARYGIVVDTHDPAANALHAVVVSEVLSADKHIVLDYDMCHLTIPMTAEFSLEDFVKEVSQAGFKWTSDANSSIQEEHQKPYLVTMARMVVSHLLYACSRTSEVSEGKNDRPPVKSGGSERKPKPAKFHQVGYRTGAAIEDTLRRIQEERRTGIATGRTLLPHIRAAHTHLYRVGKGRRDLEAKFLMPIAVNAQGDDGETTTMHPMK